MHCHFIQEHCVPKHLLQSIKRTAAGAKAKCLLTDVDPDARKPSAGVGMLAIPRMHAKEFKPADKGLHKYINMGRAGCYIIDIGVGTPLRTFVFYGWTGATARTQDRKQTAEMMRAILGEAERHNSPFLILGDLNCEPSKIGCLADALTDGFLYDIAAMKVFTGKDEALNTCLAHNTKNWTRRDFVFASRTLLPSIEAVTTIEGAGFDVHLPIQIRLSCRGDSLFRLPVLPPPFIRPEGTYKDQWRSEIDKQADNLFKEKAVKLQQALDQQDAY